MTETDVLPMTEATLALPEPEVYERGWHDRLFATRAGRLATAAIAAVGMGGAGELLMTDSAQADGQSSSTPNVSIISRQANASMESVVTKRVLFGEDEHISERGINRSRDCFKAKVFWNSMETAHGIVFFKDRNGILCHSSHSPTGLIKIGGGKTHRNCGNEAEEIEHHPHNVVPKGTRIINVTSFNMLVKVKAEANANAQANCPNSSAGAGAEASVVQKIRLRRLLRMSGSAQSKFAFSLYDKAVAKANAHANCIETVTPPSIPPPESQNRPPTVSIVNKPEHDLDTDQIQLCALSSDPDGDKLAELWTADLGTVSTPFHPDASNPDKSCVEYTPPDVPTDQTEEETVTVTVSDGQFEASDQAMFPVVDDNVRPF